MKHVFTSTLILLHIDLAKLFILEADALDIALESVLSQTKGNKQLHLVAFQSQKIEAIEINHKIHDNELLDIVDSFEH